jgi:hypothetical protein
LVHEVLQLVLSTSAIALVVANALAAVVARQSTADLQAAPQEFAAALAEILTSSATGRQHQQEP